MTDIAVLIAPLRGSKLFLNERTVGLRPRLHNVAACAAKKTATNGRGFDFRTGQEAYPTSTERRGGRFPTGRR
jgi:hypothetical protein